MSQLYSIESSLVLTPTAYNNGEALCVKPSDGSGDFDFSRNSAATRVNAQGLVENVQILSSNLVQNGDFSEEGAEEVSNGSFSQEGVQLVVGGDFSNPSDWTISGQNLSISNGKGISTGSNFGAQFKQTILTINKTYKLVFDIVDYTSGAIGLTANYYGVAQTFNSVGTHTAYFTSLNQTELRLYSENFIGSIDNVSVREVGQDWTLGTGWSIGEDKAVLTNVGYNINCTQANVTTIGQYYKIEFTILDYISGQIRISLGGSATSLVSANGTYVFYLQATINNVLVLQPLSASGTNLSITNISVKEVGQNWALAGDFEVNNQEAYITNASQYSQLTNQIGVNYLLSGKKYKLEADIETLSISGALAYRYSGGAITRIYTTDIIDGKYTAYFTMPQNGNFWFQTTGSYTGLNATITNISVIEITTDTSLPRINYEGFSYQDVLGSELVVNGDFATDSNWNKDANWSIANGVATSTGFGRMFQSIPFLETNVGTKVKVSFDITEKTNGGVVVNCYGGVSQLFTSVGTHTFVTTTINSTNLYFNNIGAGGGFIGSIDNVSVKEYLGQEVVPDSGCGSWLFEPQSTNLVTYSEDFSQSFWTKQASVTLDKGYLAPDGTYNATKISGVIGSSYVVSQGGILSSSSTKSIWAKTTSGTGVIHLGANQNQSNASFTVTNEWQRFEVTGTTTDVYAVDFRNASTTLSEVLVWGAQGENLSYATSYIPTNGEANGVTRNQDVCTNGGSLASINSTEGTLYAEIAALSLGSSASLGLNDGSGANRVLILLQGNGDIRGFVASNNTIVFDEIYSGISTLNNNKVAVSYKLNQFSLWINGTKRFTDTIGNAPIGLNQLDFDNGSGASNFFGKTKALAVWKEALSDEELTELTTI